MIFARTREKEALDDLFTAKAPAFLAVYGRRRIGKTYLIQTFFADKDCFYFDATGVANATLRDQLQNITTSLRAKANNPDDIGPITSWNDAFHALWRIIDALPKRKKVVIFLDELPWLASHRSRFLPALDYFWNHWLSRRPNTLLIVCGSAAAWMIRKVINNRGGLHNRVTHRMPLQPFTISETAEYLYGRGVPLGRRQVLELHMALGGVALYLNHVAKGQSAAENIDRICFGPGAFLADEFDRLFTSLFGAGSDHVGVIRALANKRRGLQADEIQKLADIRSGGTFTLLMDELERSGFVLSMPETGKRRRDRWYRLVDEFSLFHLTWMEKASRTKSEQGSWLRLQKSGAHNAWAGYAFENFCFRHTDALIRALRLDVVYDSISTWSIRGGGKSGAQIDLVIDRRDNTINLCELKFARDIYSVTPAYARSLNHKRERFREATKTRKQLFTTLVTTHGAKKAGAYFDAVDGQVTLDDFFG